MLRRGLLSTMAVVAVVGALPAVADGAGDLRSPDARDAAEHRGLYSLDETPLQDLRSPDARDAARDLPSGGVSTVTVRTPAEAMGGFDWGDAGIGAAGMLALMSVAAGSILLVSGRRRPFRTVQ